MIRKLNLGSRSVSARRSHRVAMIESLEGRQLLSSSLPVQFKPVAPGKILAGKTGTETVIISNATTETETEDVTVTLAPSLDGTTVAGTFDSQGASQSVTLKPHGKATIKVPFVPSTTNAAGKYHTLVTVVLGGNTYNGTAPGTYTLTVPPGPTITPSLIGHYSGLITATSTSGGNIFGGGGSTHIKQATFIWFTNAQDLTSLSGTFAVGSQQENGVTMTGGETTTGTFTYTLTSDLINYTITGKLTPDGNTLKGKFVGTLVNNIFTKMNGNFKIVRQTS